MKICRLKIVEKRLLSSFVLDLENTGGNKILSWNYH